jgi:hypothetical protein
MSFDPRPYSLEEILVIVLNIQFLKSIDTVKELSHHTHAIALLFRVLSFP